MEIAPWRIISQFSRTSETFISMDNFRVARSAFSTSIPHRETGNNYTKDYFGILYPKVNLTESNIME